MCVSPVQNWNLHTKPLQKLHPTWYFLAIDAARPSGFTLEDYVTCYSSHFNLVWEAINMWLIFMKGIYSIFLGQKICPDAKTKAWLANVQSILFSLRAGTDYYQLTICIMRYIWFIVRAEIGAEILHTFTVHAGHCFVFIDKKLVLTVYLVLPQKQIVMNLLSTAGFCYGSFYPPARHHTGQTQLGFQPLWYQQRWIYH